MPKMTIDRLRELALAARDGSFNELSLFQEEATPERVLALIEIADRADKLVVLKEAVRLALSKVRPDSKVALILGPALEACEERLENAG
jgi:hypothetical protein